MYHGWIQAESVSKLKRKGKKPRSKLDVFGAFSSDSFKLFHNETKKARLAADFLLKPEWIRVEGLEGETR